MNKMKTEFRLRFEESGCADWCITLYTLEPKTEDEIRSLVLYWAEVNSRNKEGYNPTDILDDICDANDGWYWEDSSDDLYFDADDWG